MLPESGLHRLHSTDGQAVLPSNATLIDGVGTFVVTLKTVSGSPWTVTATDTVTASSASAMPLPAYLGEAPGRN